MYLYEYNEILYDTGAIVVVYLHHNDNSVTLVPLVVIPKKLENKRQLDVFTHPRHFENRYKL